MPRRSPAAAPVLPLRPAGGDTAVAVDTPDPEPPPAEPTDGTPPAPVVRRQAEFLDVWAGIGDAPPAGVDDPGWVMRTGPLGRLCNFVYWRHPWILVVTGGVMLATAAALVVYDVAT